MGTLEKDIKAKDRPGLPEPAAGPSAEGIQEAVGVIVTASFVVSLGSGIVTSTTPSCVVALIFFGSIPAGSAIDRETDP
jgi:hypothetical protein